MSLSKLKTIDSYFQVQTKKFDLKEIVKVIINDIFVAAMCDQQKHASASDKTYAVWKELFPWIVTDFVIDSEDPSQAEVTEIKSCFAVTGDLKHLCLQRWCKRVIERMDLFGDLPEPGASKPSNKSSLHDGLPSQPIPKATQQTSSTTLYGNIRAKGSTAKSTFQKTSLYDDIPSQSLTKQPASQDIIEPEKRKHDGASDANCIQKKLKSVKYEIESYIVERQGEREDMQDSHLIIKDFTTQIPNLHPSIYRISIYGVFDGHGGVRASRFASENLHKNLRDKFPKGDITAVEKDIRKAFIDAFKKTDDDFLKLASKSKPVWKDGTTAILVLLINETMYIANIGDSQAVLCRYKEETKMCVPVPLSVPHNPSQYDERMRIQKQGGHVKDGRVMGVLEVSRSIGDGQYKKLGVTCTPDVKKCALTDNDRYVIIACDGLWKCFEPADSIAFVNKILKENSPKETEDSKAGRNNKYDAACNKLANEAILRFSGDNVTVLILDIKKGR